MFTRLLAPAVVLACAGLVVAQPTTGKQAPKTPPKSLQPAKKDAKQHEVTLKAGDRAPAINVEKWVKGQPVTGFEKGKVYVVEFWATWCPPCQKSIPHLTKIQKEHKELTVIGVTSSERKAPGADDTRVANLEKFVKNKGADMEYTVGYEGDYEMFKDWMTAAGRNGIPSAFIVGGDGKITWIGNPLDEKFDSEVEKALKSGGNSKESDKLTPAHKNTTQPDPTGNRKPDAHGKK